MSNTVAIAQRVPIKHFLNSYIEARMRHDDATQSITRLNTIFKQMNKKKQQTFRDSIYNAFVRTEFEKVEERIALIDLYKFFALPEDSHLPALYFAEGEIAATVYGDTIALKESINDLLICNTNKNPQVTAYLDTLNIYLKNIREYIPFRKTLDGIWIAAGMRDRFEKGWSHYTYPSFILDIAKQGESFLLLASNGVWIPSPMYSGYFDNAFLDPQDIVELSGDKIYLAWCSEKVKKSNPTTTQVVSSIVGETVGTIRSNIMSEIGSSFGEQLAGNIAGGLLSMGTNLLLDAIFSPNKKVTILEVELEKVNDYELLAHIHFQRNTINADGALTSKDDEKKTLSLFKVVPEMKVMFKPPLGTAKIKKLRVNSEYNDLTMARLVFASEQQMLRAGLQIPDTEIHKKYKDMVVTLGVEGTTNKNGGIRVSNIKRKTYAYFSDLKKGDIILSVDDFDVNSIDDIEDYVQSLSPFSIVTLKVLRGKKSMELQIGSSLVNIK